MNDIMGRTYREDNLRDLITQIGSDKDKYSASSGGINQVDLRSQPQGEPRPESRVISVSINYDGDTLRDITLREKEHQHLNNPYKTGRVHGVRKDSVNGRHYLETDKPISSREVESSVGLGVLERITAAYLSQGFGEIFWEVTGFEDPAYRTHRMKNLADMLAAKVGKPNPSN